MAQAPHSPPRRGMLTLAKLTDLVDSGQIDTVVVAFTDLQGRLVGKRITGWFFLEEVARHGIEACSYLIATDVDMQVLPGYRVAGWAQGYGDVRAVPDLSTLRRIPWLERTALVLCDLEHGDGRVVAESPREILKAQLRRAADAGCMVMAGAELEFYRFRETYSQAAANGYRALTPDSDTVQDYHVLQTSKDEPLLRAIRNGMDAAGIPIEGSKGEAGVAQHEVNLRYSDALETADRMVVFKNGVKELAHLQGCSVTFMAKYRFDETGSSCHVHSSLWDARGREALDAAPGEPHGMSEVFRRYVAGQVATAREMAWLFAPTVNSYKRYQPGSWAPTATVWGIDNRTCGLRVVGNGDALRVESRLPGADANPYLCLAGVVAGGLHGIDEGLALAAPFAGDAYIDADVPRVPTTLVEAIDAFAHSEVAQRAFGDDVHHHLLTTARHEWEQFNRSVTDWELRRNFERW